MNPYIELPRVAIVRGRQDIILSRCYGKKVLHLGCVDAGLLEERFIHQELMHQKLKLVANELWGVDVNIEGITFLRSKGIDKLIVGDICDSNTFDPLRGLTFDVILVSEVVEHLENPGLFLDAVSILMMPETELIITVPNAFRIDTLLQLFRGIEYVHPDHNYWFSYHTLTTLVQKKGYRIGEFYVYSLQPYGLFPTFLRKSFKHDRVNTVTVPSVTSQPPVALRDRIYKYLLSFPKRILATFLYKLTPFWGDGLIAIVHRDA